MNNENPKETNWGGKRDGSGRKPKYVDPVPLAFRIERELADSLDAMAKRTGLKRCDILERALREYLAANDV